MFPMPSWKWMAAMSMALLSLSLAGPAYKHKKQERMLQKLMTRQDVGFDISCVSCTAGIFIVEQILRFDFSEDAILFFAKTICNLFAHQPWAVCDGITTQFREEFFYVFRRLASDPAQVCAILIPGCGDPSDPSQTGWSVSLPPRPANAIPPVVPQRREKLRVLQLTDLHVDFSYKEGSEAACSDPICCHDSSGTPSKPAGYWGSVAKCDIPHRTIEHMVDFINRTLWVDYIMLSGDFVNHDDWHYDVKSHLDVLRNLSGLIRTYYPHTPTYWSLGNHEGVPVNSFAPHSVDPKFVPTWLYRAFLNISSPWAYGTEDSIIYRGSYSTMIAEGLRLISINTGFCETTNFFLYLNQSDPDGTMSWLVAQLHAAEASGVSVHILGHIPPGDSECLEGWARNYYRVVQRFNETIVAQFFGHVHWDHFTVFYENMHDITSTPINVLYAAPSATTFVYSNPAFRIYTIDPANRYRVSNFHTYYADLELANKTSPPDWKELYNPYEAYDMSDLSPRSWQTVVEKIHSGAAATDQFLRFTTRTSPTTCDAVCRKTLLCALRSGHHNDTLYCPSRYSNRVL